MNHAIERLWEWHVKTAIVLGSGLNALVDEFGSHERVGYSEFAEIPQPTVPGHAGEFVLGQINDTRLLFARGRVHLYEGHSAQAVTAGIRVMAEAGIKRLTLTNPAGCANRDFTIGGWMMLRDHLNLTGTSPLVGAPQFIDMTEVYSAKWRIDFAAANRLGLTLHEGVYAGLLGPQYETPAEVRMLRTLGADAIGMSTVLEAIQARALGLELAAFSCLTNWAAGMGEGALNHDEVLATGQRAAAGFSAILSSVMSSEVETSHALPIRESNKA